MLFLIFNWSTKILIPTKKKNNYFGSRQDFICLSLSLFRNWEIDRGTDISSFLVASRGNLYSTTTKRKIENFTPRDRCSGEWASPFLEAIIILLLTRRFSRRRGQSLPICTLTEAANCNAVIATRGVRARVAALSSRRSFASREPYQLPIKLPIGNCCWRFREKYRCVSFHFVTCQAASLFAYARLYLAIEIPAALFSFLFPSTSKSNLFYVIH